VSALLLTPSKKFRLQKTTGNILTSNFWGNQYGILLTDYLPKGQTNNALYYASLLVQLEDILKVKRLGKFKKCVLFLHDNVPTHQALAFRKKLAYLGIQYLEYLLY